MDSYHGCKYKVVVYILKPVKSYKLDCLVRRWCRYRIVFFMNKQHALGFISDQQKELGFDYCKAMIKRKGLRD